MNQQVLILMESAPKKNWFGRRPGGRINHPTSLHREAEPVPLLSIKDRRTTISAALPDAMDTEMTDTAAALPGDVRELLALARQLITQGKPSQALQMVMTAARNQGGEDAMFQSLTRARELYRMRLQESNSVDQLATLFAECAIAGTESPKPQVQCNASGVVTPNIHERSILAETGRNQLVLDAFADGSSFICLQCGGLVSVNRKDEHFTYWCSN